MTSTSSARRFGFPLYPTHEELDLIGPWEWVTPWPDGAWGPDDRPASEWGGVVAYATGIAIAADDALTDCPPRDNLRIADGCTAFDGRTNELRATGPRDTRARGRHGLSVGTGHFTPRAAGLPAASIVGSRVGASGEPTWHA